MSERPATVSVVCEVHLAKPEALEILEPLLATVPEGGDVLGGLRLASGALLTIQVPKFGEDLPLTLDLTGSVSQEELHRIANEVSGVISQHTGWTCHIIF